MKVAYGLVEVPDNNIFMSKEFYEPDQAENAKKVGLILIPGGSSSCAGVWSNSVCVNANLELGSMLP